MTMSNLNTSKLQPQYKTPNANFSNGATGNYSVGNITYKYVTFTGNGTLTVTTAGMATLFLVGGGGGSGAANGQTAGSGGAGGYIEKDYYLEAGTYSVTIGNGGVGESNGGDTSVVSTTLPGGLNIVAFGGGAGGHGSGVGSPGGGGSGGCGGGAGYGVGAYSGSAVYGGAQGYGTPVINNTQGSGQGGTNGSGRSSSITGTTVTYGTAGTSVQANTGNGGSSPGGNGSSGVVVVRVRTN